MEKKTKSLEVVYPNLDCVSIGNCLFIPINIVLGLLILYFVYYIYYETMSIIYITLHVRTTFLLYFWNISDVLISLKVSLCNQKDGKNQDEKHFYLY